MVPSSGGLARTIPANRDRQPAGRLYTLHCLKIEEKKISYNIYGFSINKIYKKTLQYVYLGFSVGIKVVKKLFLNVKIKAVASDSGKVNGAQCRQSRRRS